MLGERERERDASFSLPVKEDIYFPLSKIVRFARLYGESWKEWQKTFYEINLSTFFAMLPLLVPDKNCFKILHKKKKIIFIKQQINKWFEQFVSQKSNSKRPICKYFCVNKCGRPPVWFISLVTLWCRECSEGLEGAKLFIEEWRKVRYQLPWGLTLQKIPSGKETIKTIELTLHISCYSV